MSVLNLFSLWACTRPWLYSVSVDLLASPPHEMKNKQTSTTSWEPNNERMKLLLNSSAKTKEKKKRSSIGRSDEIYSTVIAWLNGKSVCVSSSWVQIVKYPNSHSLVCSVCLQCMLAASDSRVQRAHVGVCKCVCLLRNLIADCVCDRSTLKACVTLSTESNRIDITLIAWNW